MLENDQEVDWEVDMDELETPRHPHRVPLRGGALPRRAGQPPAPQHLCLCPLPRRPAPLVGAQPGALAPRPPSSGARSCEPRATPLCHE